MKSLNISTKNALSRRSFLRGTGVALSLPLLDAMIPAFARAEAAARLRVDWPAGRWYHSPEKPDFRL